MSAGRPAWRDDLRFPNRAEDLRAASVTFTSSLEPGGRTVEIFFVGGHLFSLLFDRPVPRAIDEADVTVGKVEQLADLQSLGRTSTWSADTVRPLDFAIPIPEDARERARVADVEVSDPDSARLVALDQGQFYVLAERTDIGALGVARGSQDGAIYLLRFDGAEPKPMGTSFLEALSALAELRA